MVASNNVHFDALLHYFDIFQHSHSQAHSYRASRRCGCEKFSDMLWKIFFMWLRLFDPSLIYSLGTDNYAIILCQNNLMNV